MRTRRSLPSGGAVSGPGVTVFSAGNAGPLLDRGRLPPRRSAVWLAEALNEAATNYYTTFALMHADGPAATAGWLRELAASLDQCLARLAPDADAGRPDHADPRAQAALFQLGEPLPATIPEIARLFADGPAARFGYSPLRDALDAAPGLLWDLRAAARVAEAAWVARLTPRERRRQGDAAALRWIANLADIHRRLWGRAAPGNPKAESPFVRFADRAGRIAATAPDATDAGTDAAARARLRQLGAAAIAGLMRRRRGDLRAELARLESLDWTPERIALGSVED
ncbi:MAG: hypothetical protein U1E23_08115 [Reyranellaceae bacterium]